MTNAQSSRSTLSAGLDRAIADLPRLFPGPGGAVAVVKDGHAVAAHAFGFANLENRLPYTSATLAPICSITKQFTCALMLDLAPDPGALDAAIAAQLPRLSGVRPTALDLANNQSGLRDYWALTVLCGAHPEGEFRPTDARTLIAATTSLHFAPGTRYSYSNGNFRMLATAIEERAARPFGDLLLERIVRPAGMTGAVFAPETSQLPGGAAGYEGTAATGYRPAVNNIHWSGDAGLVASLDDMIAWESFIDATRDDALGLYRRLCTNVAFADGNRASYGLGLARKTCFGRAATGHGGAIRGWRIHRINIASERLSVVVFFNSEQDSQGAAMHILAAALGEEAGPGPSRADLAPTFGGCWIDDATGLLLDVEARPNGTLAATYAGGAETMRCGLDGIARSAEMSLAIDGDGLLLRRPADNIASRARKVGGTADTDIEGRFRSAELDADMAIVSAGGGWFAVFDGLLGKGPMMPLSPVGYDLWRLSSRRSLDAPAPGDWTLRIRRSDSGVVEGLDIGCWLARDVAFRKV